MSWSELVLNFDGSVVPSLDAVSADYTWAEQTIRYGCSLGSYRRVVASLPTPPSPRCLSYLGSGDFHHISLALIENAIKRTGTRLHLVVLDNHPDNMLYLFGIHCGSWIYHAARLKEIDRVTVIGITSSDIRGLHILENRLGVLRNGKVHYWCFCPTSSIWTWLAPAGVQSVSPRADLLVKMLKAQTGSMPIYLSIDKDVLLAREVQTNWDQGILSKTELLEFVTLLSPRLAGADICGELSNCTYASIWKKLLTRIDGQTPVPMEDSVLARAAHQELNSAIRTIILSQ